MSANEKRKFASTDEMQEHVNGLVASGAIVVGPRKRLRVGDDGLLQVIDPARSQILMPYSDARKRLINVINYLESSAGPKSVSWCDALNKLQLLDSNAERNGQLDIRAWKICTLAHKKTIEDITYIDLLPNISLQLNGNGFLCEGHEEEWRKNRHTTLQFPQRACRLLGVCTSNDYREKAWDDGLADEMLEKDLGAYRLIDRCFGLLVEFEKSGLAYCEYQKGPKVKKYMEDFRELQPIKALDAIMENEHFLILERKAKTAQRGLASQATAPAPREQAAQKQEVDSD